MVCPFNLQKKVIVGSGKKSQGSVTCDCVTAVRVMESSRNIGAAACSKQTKIYIYANVSIGINCTSYLCNVSSTAILYYDSKTATTDVCL